MFPAHLVPASLAARLPSPDMSRGHGTHRTQTQTASTWKFDSLTPFGKKYGWVVSERSLGTKFESSFENVRTRHNALSAETKQGWVVTSSPLHKAPFTQVSEQGLIRLTSHG